MNDRACTVCGHQPAEWSGIWQGSHADLCYECWDALIGDYEEPIGNEEGEYDDD